MNLDTTAIGVVHPFSRRVWVRSFVGYVAAVIAIRGLEIHPFHILLVLASLDLLASGSRAVDRILVAVATVVGFVPVFGWFALPVVIDPLAVVIGVWVVQLLDTHTRPSLRSGLQSVAVLPAVAAAVWNFQWWCGISKGRPAEVLERLIPIWDLSAHFNFFLTCLMKKTYIIATPPPAPNLRWEGTEYPAGIHYVWSRFAVTHRESVIDASERAIPIFANSIVVTVSVAILVIGFATARLADATHRRFAYGCIGSGAAVALLTLGPMSQTTYAGFANMAAVVISLAVFMTYFLREHSSAYVSAWTLGCAISGVAYNWYPIVLLLVPGSLLYIARMWRGKSWKAPVLFSAMVTLCSGPAVLQTFSLGVKHLELPGGVQSFPNGIFAFLLLATFSLSVVCWTRVELRSLAVLAVAPLIACLAIGIRLRIVTGSYPYYFHKASLFIGTAAALIMILGGVFLVERVASSSPSKSQLPQSRFSFVGGALVLGFSLTYIFGYWGIDYPTFSGGGTAVGVLTRNDITKGDTNFAPTAELVIRKIKEVRALPIEERSCLTMIIPLRLGAKPDSPIGTWQLTLTNVWFHGLTESYTFQAKEQAYMTPNVASALGSETDLLDAIVKTYDPQSNCIYSSDFIVDRLPLFGPKWRTKSLEK